MSSIIKKADVRPGEGDSAESPALPASCAPSRSRRVDDKRVVLVRVGERVHALELVCSCGETTLIEFDYPEDSPTGAAG